MPACFLPCPSGSVLESNLRICLNILNRVDYARLISWKNRKVVFILFSRLLKRETSKLLFCGIYATFILQFWCLNL